MEELVGARGKVTQIKVAYTLAARRRQTEMRLLDLVNAKKPEDLPAIAIHALAVMPSVKAERAFMRVLLAPPKDDALREHATKGLQKLKAMRRVDADSAADPVADAETQALHRATREIRDAMAARAAGADAVADADPVADPDPDPDADPCSKDDAVRE
jgi:hypothetical protein